MKKILLLTLVITVNFIHAQFSVSDTSSDWNLLDSSPGNVALYTKGESLKIKLKDGRSEMSIKDITQPSRTVLDDIYKEQKKSNEGVRNGYYEMIFSASGSTVDDLYSLIENHFKEKKVEDVTLNFPEGNLYLKFHKDVFQYLVSFGIENNGSIIYSGDYSMAGVRHIFGKRKSKI